MKKLLFIISIISISVWLVSSGCAVIVPPTGGPKDSLPPVLVDASPRDSTLHFNAKEIKLTFNEYVDLDNPLTNIIVSPVSPHNPNVTRNLNHVTIQLKDSLKPNTTYSFNFGNTIKDVNEGNIMRNFVYVFSTGDHLDTNTVSGTVRLAETGGADSTMFAVLYTNFADTAIHKSRPEYYAKIDSSGKFVFRFLPEKKFRVFAVANTYNKNYADSTDNFAFLDKDINTADDSLCQNLKLYAFQAYPKETKKTQTTVSAKQKEKEKERDSKKPLTVSNNLQQGKQSLLTPFELTYNKPLKNFDASQVLLTDTNGVHIQDYQVVHDSTDTTNTKFIVKTTWLEDSAYRLIIPKEAAKDSFDIALTKADTVLFQAKDNHDYATVELDFIDVDTTMNPVLQIFSSDNKLTDSLKIPDNRKVTIPMYEPGKYTFRILYDKNGDMKWTPGNYEKRLQPEIVIALKGTFEFKADAENQWDIHLKQQEPIYKPINL